MTRLRLLGTLALITLIAAPALAQVPYSRLLNADDEPEAWLMYSGNYRSERFSRLDQITKENVSGLRPAWIYQTGTIGRVEVTPLVADGVMYIAEPPSTIVALDAHTGRRLWRYDPIIPEETLNIGFPRTNRGIAILGDTVFFGTLDAQLIALDRTHGDVRWKVPIADNAVGYAVTAAPLAVDGKVIVGISGGEAGVRGFLDAYDAETGERVWRWWSVPAEGEPGNDTWGGDSWKTGGGATWLTGSYDPELGLLYWPTGNPAPDWNGDSRPGDNLYTDSLVALDVNTGEMRWYFQYTPHDVHDWDANQIPVLVDAEWDGTMRKLVILANRNAFYYVLDRETGQFLRATQYATQTWAERIDENGRPVRIPGTSPSEEGTLVWPSLAGSTNWYSPAYDPDRMSLFVPTREMSSIYFKSEAEYEPGTAFVGGGERRPDSDETYGAVRALDALTGELKWEFKQLTPAVSGVLATAGGLVISGTQEGNVFAVDSDTGEPLWDFYVGGGIRAAPMSFALDGQQYISVAAGQSIFTFALSPGADAGGNDASGNDASGNDASGNDASGNDASGNDASGNDD
jgi:alcohol dehydrogenase (cytochrome c)